MRCSARTLGLCALIPPAQMNRANATLMHTSAFTAKNRSMSRTRATRHHELHSGHFAFMRAAVQGVDARASWDRYLRLEGEHVDARPKVSFGRKG